MDPICFDLVSQIVQEFQLFNILHRLITGQHPAITFPFEHPFVDTADGVLRVSVEIDFTGTVLNRLTKGDDCRLVVV